MRGLGLAMVLAALPAGAEDRKGPAELPPAQYAGQQYVDSRGCLFMRAGQPGREMWLPRVTRDGVPVCGYPPSGNRVAVAAGGAQGSVAADAETDLPAAGTGKAPAAEPGYYVAVGSFGVAANADKALARLESLNYPTARGRLEGGSTALVTVFAGPFDGAENAARAQSELRALGFPDAVVIGP